MKKPPANEIYQMLIKSYNCCRRAKRGDNFSYWMNSPPFDYLIKRYYVDTRVQKVAKSVTFLLRVYLGPKSSQIRDFLLRVY